MNVSYPPPLHLVTNYFNAASAELEFKGHFLEIWKTLKPQQENGILLNLHTVKD